MAELNKNDVKLIEKRLGRKTNDLELGIFHVMWSEHCSYRTSKPYLKKLYSTSKRKLVGEGENAGVLDIGKNYFVAFKMESHNHPSAIEPYQGAATGIGGILRDIFTMGARPVASGDPLYFGSMKKKKNAHLLKGVVKGISDYGNSVGVPILGGETFFDDSYDVNCLVNVFALGIGKKEDLIKGVASGKGNIILYFGSKTGRDGVHGATFASVELSEKSKQDRPSVQIGNPFEEKKLIEAIMEIAEKKLVVSMQDMGAAGLTSSSVEMAQRGNVGLEMDLSKIPLREDDISFYEMMLSETQERMLAVVEKKNLKKLLSILEKNEIEYAIIGKIIDGNELILKDGRKRIACIPLDILLENIPPSNNAIEEVNREKSVTKKIKKDNIKKCFLRLLKSDNINSKKWIYE
ncbi:phosphoribosylformylglycinamidine synthase subunit PurL, partial [bacterium]|nr:phosphoribosylformylglycinamidine synthase subunit PurL [bacterium]